MGEDGEAGGCVRSESGEEAPVDASVERWAVHVL